MGDRKRFFGFGKSEYQAPQVAPVAPIPENQSEKKNGIYINESLRTIRIDVFDHGVPEDLEMCLGTLLMAQDVIKQTITNWHVRDQRTQGLIKVPGNGAGHA